MPDMFRIEAADYWPVERELLATIAEICHSLLLVTAKAYGGKNLPEPLHIPRPHEHERGFESPATTPASKGGQVLSFKEFATYLRTPGR